MTAKERLDADVVVVGLGSMGSMAAWRLARRPGVRVVGIEQYGIGHAHGAFSGESRLFRTAYHEGAGYVPMLLRARELWLELGDAAGQRLLYEVGTLSIGRRGDESLRAVLESIERYGLPHGIFDGRALAARWPQHVVDASHLGIFDALGGALRPEAAVIAAVEQASRHGAEISAGECVVALDRQPDGSVIVHTDRRQLRTAAVVVSAGPWAGNLLPEVKAKTEIYPLLLTWFLPRDFESFEADSFPTFIRDEDGVHFFGAPSVDGYSVKVSPARLLPPVASIEDLPTTVAPEVLSRVGAAAQRFFRGLHPEPIRYSVHPDAFTLDKVPIIDRSPDGAIVTLAGFSGHGFKFAPVIGEMAADLALGGQNEFVDESFALAAHHSVADAPEFAAARTPASAHGTV